jgi:anti-sigma regulatory factor (Ser/Thr protein kinase)
MDGLLSIARGLPVESAAAAGQALLSAVERFRGSAPPADDETVVALERRGGGPCEHANPSAPSCLHLKFVMPSDPRYLPVVRGAIGPLAAAIGWDESDCLAITLALDEALANIIRHAYHNRADGLIELECRESADGLEVTLLDNGEAPDRTKICARAIACDQPGDWELTSSRM